jgi:replicative DNA helicase Mcm
MAKKKEISEEKRSEYIARFKEFLHKKYYENAVKAAGEDKALIIDFQILDKYSPEFGEFFLSNPESSLDIVKEAVKQTELPGPLVVRFSNLPEPMSIRNLRSRHIRKMLAVEGTVRRASEIRPEIMRVVWECPECGDLIERERVGGMIPRIFDCKCGNKRDFKKSEEEMIDTRWVVIEEPFELTEGDRPSQVTILLTDDLVSPDGRRLSDPGNRIKITGILKEMPRGGKFQTAKLDFYIDANHVEPIDIGWHQLDITKEDIAEIKKLSKSIGIYDMLVDSLAPSLFGLREIKEAIIMQLFGGVPAKLKDGTNIRGDIHILLVGDPASGKSQLLKLVPDVVPRGRYVSGKGVTGAGLTATVTKDEQFMGGWVLEAGALVLTNKGLLAVDEFEKMNPDDQVAMHEGLEQGTVSIAKASIVATLPAKTAVLAGGNPKFSRFDPYVPISKQITIPDTLLTRFDLKFAMRDVPNAERDTMMAEHVIKTRENNEYEPSQPKLSQAFIRKYIAYARENSQPKLTPDVGKLLKKFYINTRKRAEGASAPVPITLRQLEALMRIAQASAKIQLQPAVRKEDAQRAIRLMKYSLQQLGFDPETGMIDVDRSEGSVTSAERSRIRVILDIIDEMSATKKEILVDDILNAAKKDGVDDAEEVLEKLKREGMLFEPSPGYVQKV